jgi:lipoate-protein ligase A
MSSWRILDTGSRDGAWNMAVDEALLRGVAECTTPPTLRVFGWDPPTVSTGHSQDVATELDLAACEREGFGVVRRPTGGRAVLHAGELTYSVVGPAGVRPLGNTILETYLAISGALLRGLERLGVEAELAQASGVARPRGETAAPPCFASAGRFEITVGGRKLVGSAQRRMPGAVLQHGSLLIDATHAAKAGVLRIDERRRDAVRRMLLDKTTNLETVLGRDVSFSEVADSLAEGFAIEWGVNLEPGDLSEVEIRRADRLATEYTM